MRRFGTNNLPDCSNMCHESSGVALTETIGIGKGSVSLDDIHAADLIFVVGQNPGTNHPRMLSALERAKESGGRIVAVNPLPEAGLLRFKDPQRVGGVLGRGTSLADRYLQVRVNGDLALFLWLGRRLLEASAVDSGFLDRLRRRAHRRVRRVGGARARPRRGRRWSALRLVTRRASRRRTRWWRASSSIVVCWAMGLTQHRNAVATIREIVNFLLLRGNIGRPGAGVCPVRGHSNVQGDRTMGIDEKPPAVVGAARGEVFGFTPPAASGSTPSKPSGRCATAVPRCSWAWAATSCPPRPDTAATEAALRRCRLTVQVSTKLNRSHVVVGEQALILPALGRTDTGEPVTVEDSMGVVHVSRRLPRAAVAGRPLRGGDRVPAGAPAARAPTTRCRGSRSRPTTTSSATASPTSCPASRTSTSACARPAASCWRTGRVTRARSRRRLAGPGSRSTSCPSSTCRPGHLLLQTIRSHDQYNTTIYGLDDRYRGVKGGRRVVFVHPSDLADAGFADGDDVDVVSVLDGRRAPGRVVPRRRLPDGAGLLRRVLPRGERARPARQHRRGEQHADVEVGRRQARACARRIVSRRFSSTVSSSASS